MSDNLLFKCLLYSEPKVSLDLKEDGQTNWKTKFPPIVDIIVISEDNIDILPRDYCVVLNQSGQCIPKGSILFNSKRKGYVCVKRFATVVIQLVLDPTEIVILAN